MSRRRSLPRACAASALIVLLCSGLPATAHQDPPPGDPHPAPPTARSLAAEGLRLARSRQLAEAERVLESAVERADVEGDLLAKGNAFWGLASVRGALGDTDGRRKYDAAAEEALLAAGDDNALGNFLNGRGIDAQARGDAEAAEASWTAALSAFQRSGNRASHAEILRNLTFLPGLSADAKLARLDEALALLPAGTAPRTEGAIRHQAGDLLFVLGDVAGALAAVEAALPLLDSPTTRVQYGRALISLARLYRVQGDPGRARTLSERAAETLLAAGDGSGAAQAQVAAAIASADLGLISESISTLGRAVATARKGGRPDTLASVLGQQAAVLTSAGRTAEVWPLLDEASGLAVEPGARSVLSGVRATALLAAGRHQAALNAIDEAIAGQRTLALDLQFQQHALKAAILAELGHAADALASSGEAIALLERLRGQVVQDDFFKRAFGERVRAHYAQHVRLLLSLGRAREALEAAERARARAFLDLLATRDARRRDAGTDVPAVADREPAGSTSPQSRAGTATGTPGGAGATPNATPPDRAEPVRTRGAIVAAAPAGREVTVTRAANLRALESRVAAEPPDIDGMTQVASRLSSTVISYWVDEGRTWAWVLAADGTVTHHELPIGERELARRVRSTWALADGPPPARQGGREEPQASPVHGDRTSASDSGPPRETPPNGWVPLTRGSGRLVIDANARRSARRLYDLLVAPLRASLPRTPGALLTIVPHGPLHRLSFAGLAAPGGRYLVEDFRIHYAPSIGVLRASALPRPSPAASRAVVVANPRLPADLARRSDLPPLPGALAEGLAVAREIGKASVVSLTGQSASEARVRQEVPPADVLHFATHGVVRDDSPFESFLALASEHPHDSRDDGRLTTAEVYDLKLDAGMVVLSACRSASGPVTGDGVMGLTRAFTYAGAPSVVASLWDLPDEAARVVIPRFYRAWRAGGDRADALRTAQIQLLRALRAGRVAVDTPAGRLALPEHPAIWAGLVLLGQP